MRLPTSLCFYERDIECGVRDTEIMYFAFEHLGGVVDN